MNEHAQQLDLFGDHNPSAIVDRMIVETAEVAARKRTRKTDVETSFVAVERLAKSGKLIRDAEAALELIEKHPGCTGYELDAIDDDPRERRISRRLGELASEENDRLLHRWKRRQCEKKGSLCVTWYLREQLMIGDTMPDADTCTSTPVDSSGDPIVVGKYVRPARRGRSIGIEVMEDPDSGGLLYRPKGTAEGGWIRIEESDPGEWKKARRVEGWDQ